MSTGLIIFIVITALLSVVILPIIITAVFNGYLRRNISEKEF